MFMDAWISQKVFREEEYGRHRATSFIHYWVASNFARKINREKGIEKTGLAGSNGKKK
jgi:hypothetical protein